MKGIVSQYWTQKYLKVLTGILHKHIDLVAYMAYINWYITQTYRPSSVYGLY